MRLAILIHEHDDFHASGYMMPIIADALRRAGVDVAILAGTRHPVDADACLVHVDLTRVPDEYRAFAARFPKVLNPCWDISKRVVSRNLVRRGDGYTGPVIVKTDRNCGGIKEAEAARRSTFLRRTVRSLHRRLPWPVRNEIPGKKYFVFDSPARVPWPVWWNPALVVEKFRPQMEGGYFCLNSWHFFGDAETHSIRKATTPIVSVPSVVSRGFVTPSIPEPIRALRRELGFDFGKFDFTIAEGGVPVLFDANRTPTNVSLSPEELTRQCEQLAPGITSLLR